MFSVRSARWRKSLDRPEEVSFRPVFLIFLRVAIRLMLTAVLWFVGDVLKRQEDPARGFTLEDGLASIE